MGFRKTEPNLYVTFSLPLTVFSGLIWDVARKMKGMGSDSGKLSRNFASLWLPSAVFSGLICDVARKMKGIFRLRVGEELISQYSCPGLWFRGEGQLCHFKVIFGSFCGHFEVILWSLCVHFFVPLRLRRTGRWPKSVSIFSMPSSA